MPFRISPILSTVVITVAVSAAILAIAYVAAELHRGGRVEADAEHAQAQADAEKQAGDQATAAARAREAAFRQGAIGRMRANWCANCEGNP